jgi:hypothetical protein
MAGRWTTNWSDQTPGAAPTGWSRGFGVTSGTWSIVAGAGKDGVSNALRLTGATNTLNALLLDAVNSDPDRANFQVLMRWSNSNATGNQDARGIGRAVGTSTTTADAIQGGYSNGTRRVAQLLDGTQTVFQNSTADSPVSAANVWRLTRLDVQGNVYRTRTWLDDGSAEPSTWDVSYTNATEAVTAPGGIGVYQNIINGQTTWDEVAIATGNQTATFTPAKEVTIVDSLDLSDPGSTLNSVNNIVVIDSLGLSDTAVTDLVSNFSRTVTDRLNLSDTVVTNLARVVQVQVIDSMELLDDVLEQTLIPRAPDPIDPPPEEQPDLSFVRGTEIIQQLIAAGYTVGTIMDRERQRLLAKTGANPVGNTLQDLYRIANERPRL